MKARGAKKYILGCIAANVEGAESAPGPFRVKQTPTSADVKHNIVSYENCCASATEGGVGGIIFSGCPSVRPSRFPVIAISQEPLEL